ncbi:MAG: glycosyltransferase family 4 protein [Proteobacteria bacterium]|nr:glycosyltransferase family 4 protein [Pseudomonadota bacterium]
MQRFQGMEGLKILIVMHGAGKGGVEKSIAILCKYLDKERFEPIVAMPSDGPLKAYLDGIGIKTIITPLEWWTPLHFFYGDGHYYRFLSGLKNRVNNLVRIINENEINLVHSSTLTVADGAIAAKLSGRPHVWHIHGRFDGTSPTFGTYLPIDVLYPIVGELSTRIVAVSQIVKDFLCPYIAPSKINLINNGIDIDKFKEKTSSSKSLLEEFPTLKNKVLVGLVGRIARVKGIEDYIEAAINVLRIRDDVGFLVVGPEEDKTLGQKVRKRVDSSNFADNIVFTGYRKDIPGLLQGIDLVVCSSLKEGFPYSCLEAMAASKALVATKCGGPEEMVIDGETGYLVDVDNPNELARAILKVAENPKTMKSMGERGRKRIEQFFEARVYAQNFENLYKDVVTEKPLQLTGSSVWEEVMLDLLSSHGNIGKRLMECERQIEDLRRFEQLLKDNFFYRTMKRFYRSFI